MTQHRIILALIPLMAACWCPPDLYGNELDEPACEVDWDVGSLDAGRTAWDGLRLRIDADGHGCHYEPNDGIEPWVVDSSGAIVPLEPVGTCPRWQPAGGFEPGDYSFEGLIHVEMPAHLEPGGVPMGARPFTVEHWGRDPSFEPAVIEGRSYRIESTTLPSCSSAFMAEFWPDYTEGSLHLEIHSVDEHSAEFRLVREPEEDGQADACGLMGGTATISATGELSWALDEVAVESDPPLEIRDLFFRAGFDGEGQEVHGIETRAIIDMRGLEAMDELDSWQDACNLTASFGWPCEACEDEVNACLPFDLFEGQAELEDRALDAKLPPCFVSPDIPDWGWDTGWTWPDCEPSCAASSPRGWALFWILVGMALLIRRNRR